MESEVISIRIPVDGVEGSRKSRDGRGIVILCFLFSRLNKVLGLGTWTLLSMAPSPGPKDPDMVQVSRLLDERYGLNLVCITGFPPLLIRGWETKCPLVHVSGNRNLKPREKRGPPRSMPRYDPDVVSGTTRNSAQEFLSTGVQTCLSMNRGFFRDSRARQPVLEQ